MKGKNKYIIVWCVVKCFSLLSQPVCNNPTTANCSDVVGGSSRFYMTTNPNIVFTFSDIRDYYRGIELCGATQLRLKIDSNNINCKWKLIMYIDNNGFIPSNEWEPILYYGNTGYAPQLNLIEVKVYNGCGTPLNNGIYQIFTNNTNHDVIEIIPELPVQNLPGNCDGNHVNSAGSYLTHYNEYNFNIDYRIKPDFNLKLLPGVYRIKINFCLVEVP
ncbi:MAG: hypothetical protein N3A01_08680 [Bacteroidales bacterium]|nr:hypothetical protein [Bacteroidales bacterium]